MIITISDNSEYVARHVRRTEPRACLLDLTNHQHTKSGEQYYTSLADLPSELLLPLCLRSDEVAYYPPPVWTSTALEQHTEEFLKMLIDVYQLNVHGFSSGTNRTDVMELKSQRNSQTNVLWICGCSYAVGRGLFSNQDRYGVQLGQMLQVDHRDLCELASGVDWQADQILRSDIRKNDIVTWGLPSANRLCYFIDSKVWFATANTVASLDQDTRFFHKMITDDNILYQSIRRFKQVVNFCEKVQARLVLFYHNMGLDAHNKKMLQYLSAEPGFLNLSPIQDKAPGSKIHPGPITNRAWAREIYEFLQR